jgi:hypothetical protein
VAKCPIFILDAAPGDRPALQKFLDEQRAEYGGSKWFMRVEQAMADGDLVRAWELSAAASQRSVGRVGLGALTAEQRAQVKQMAFAHVFGRTKGIGQQTIPNPPRIPRRAQGKGVTVGFGGVLQPPGVKRPLKPGQTDVTLSRAAIQAVLRKTLPEGIVLGRANKESEVRLFSQVAEKSILGLNTAELRRYHPDLTPVEIASHMKRAVSTAAKILNDFSQWRAANIDHIKLVDEIMLKGGVDEAALVRLSGKKAARLKVSEETLDILAQDGWSLEKLQALMAVSKPVVHASKVSAITSFSRGFLISQPITAARNLWTQTGRYGVGSVDQALAGAFDLATGNPIGKGKIMFAQELFRAPRRVKDLLVNNSYRPQAETLQTMFDFTTDLMNRPGVNPQDIRRTLAVVDSYPSEAGRFMGFAAGEAQRDSTIVTGSEWIDKLVNSKRVRNYLTIANRAQEFPSRAGLIDAKFRAILRERGADPNNVLGATFDTDGAIVKDVNQKLLEVFGRDEDIQAAVAESVLTALDWTFAGQAAKGSVPAKAIEILNTIPPVRDLVFPFPRFNLVSATRFVYEYSPAGLLEFFRQPWSLHKPKNAEELLLPPGGFVQRRLAMGRLATGKRALMAQREFLPEILGKSQRAEIEHGQAVARLVETKRELGVRNRMLKRAQRQAAKGTDLDPSRATNLEAAQAKVDELTAAAERGKQETLELRARQGVLAQQESNLRETIETAAAIGAPNSAGDVLSRSTIGLAGFTALIALRASSMADDTEWSQLRVPTPFGNTMLVDMRPFAPLLSPQMLVADVLVDYHDNTNWHEVMREMGANDVQGLVMSPIDTFNTMLEHYEGKYPAGKLGMEFAEAFLSISRSAGTTLSVFDLAEGYGLSPDLVGQALIGTLGQFIARFTIPFRPLKDIAGQFIEEEAITRIPPDSRQTFKVNIGDSQIEVPLVGPLLAPLSNIPFASRAIPGSTVEDLEGNTLAEFSFGERISPFTGEARRSVNPAQSQFGLTVATPKLPESVPFVGGSRLPLVGPVRQIEETEMMRLFTGIGMPGRSMYLERSGSVEVDNLGTLYYHELLNQTVPRVLDHPAYKRLADTPALQRDLWQSDILPSLKSAVRAMLIRDLGLSRIEEVTLSTEEKRRRQRWLRAVERLEELQPPVPEEEEEEDELDFGPEPDLTGGPPPLPF